MPTPKLSITMTRAVDAIRAAGGEAHPVTGGFWHGSADPASQKLEIAMDGRQSLLHVGSQTVMSLADRGLLEKLPGTGNHVYSAYRLTRKADDVSEGQDSLAAN